MSEWKEYKLGEIISLHRGYDLPSSQRKKGTIPIVSSSGISDYHDSYKMLPPGVVTGRYGTIGEVFFLNEPYWPLNTTLYIDDFKGNNPLFIYYFLKSFDFEKFNDKSTIPGINRNHLYGEVVKIPSLEEQKRIASILSSLDDKIDLLNRENATLEAMAATLFRQWFIEEAKEDWEEGKLGDLIEVKYGKDHKKLNDGTIPVFGSGGIMRYAESALYYKESVLIPRKGSLNNVMYIDEPFWTVDTMFYTEMHRPNIAKFIFHFMKGQDLENMNVGSAVPSMTTEVLNNIPLDIPPQELFDKFEKTVSVFYLKQKQNRAQIRNLSKQRDILLPKLMSNSNII
jgi:type I restriction enzyme S subunit